MPLAAVAEATDSVTRTRILNAAEQRFAAFGYRRTGIAEIARQAGIAAGTVYRYFASKEDIFRAVMKRLVDAWLARAHEVLTAPGTAVERLLRLGQASVAFNQENVLVNSVFRRDEEIICVPLLDQLHEDMVERNVAMIADVVRDGIREGTLRALDPERTAFILFSGGDTLSNQNRYPYQDVLPLYADITFNGLLARPGAAAKTEGSTHGRTRTRRRS